MHHIHCLNLQLSLDHHFNYDANNEANLGKQKFVAGPGKRPSEFLGGPGKRVSEFLGGPGKRFTQLEVKEDKIILPTSDERNLLQLTNEHPIGLNENYRYFYLVPKWLDDSE